LNQEKLRSIKLPLPPLDVQEEIVYELEQYQKIIDGAKQVVDNYKPIIDIDPSWEMKELGEILSVQNGYAFKSNLFNDEIGFPIIRIRNIKTNSTKTKYNGDFDKSYIVEDGDLLVGMDGEFNCCIWEGGDSLLNQRVCKLFNIQRINVYLLSILLQKELKIIEDSTNAVTVKHISSSQIERIKIPIPPDDEMKIITEELLYQKQTIEGNKKLIEIYTQKIKDRINKIWGE
jgi:restriction endonuclease S subunit